MKLVKFEDGTYGVRTYWFFGWHFADLTSGNFCWRTSSRWFSDCKGTEEQARRRAKKVKYEVIE